MNQPIDVLVIRGAPAAGKSTLGRGLRRVLERGAVVEVDDVRAMLAQVDWTSRTHHDVALDVAVTVVERFVALGWRPAVLIDTFSRNRLRGAQARLYAAGLHHHTVSLWVEPNVLAARLEARTVGFKEWEPSRVLNEEVLTNRYTHERLIDATALERDALLELVVGLVHPTAGEGAP